MEDNNTLVASPLKGRSSSKRKHGEKEEENTVEWVYFIYNSDEKRDCMYTTLMNITQNPAYSALMLPAIVPNEVFIGDRGIEITNERTLINVLVHHQIISGPNNTHDLPSDINIQEYVQYFDDRFGENLDDFKKVIHKATFLILHLKLMAFDNEDYHFVPVVKFGDTWIVMGGEQRSLMCAISENDLPSMLFSVGGREQIRQHCNKPFLPVSSIQFHSAAFCIVPLYFGPKESISYIGMQKTQLVRMLPWQQVSSTATRMTKDHAFVIKMGCDNIERLVLLQEG